MSYLKRLFAPRASIENPNIDLTDPNAWEEMCGTTKTKAGVRVNSKSALGHPPLWKGVNLIANGVARLPLTTYRRTDDGREKATDHPAYRILKRKAGTNLSARELKRVLSWQAVLYGNAYASIFRVRDRDPAVLRILSPFDTFSFWKEGKLWYRTIVSTEDGKREVRKIEARNILHIRGLGPDGINGYSVIELLADAIGTDIAPREFAARFFSQGMGISGILMIPGHLKRTAIQEAIADFNEIATGISRQHKIGLLQDGVKWQPTGTEPEKGQMLESREFGLLDVANILNLPPHKLGHPGRTSYASLENEQQSFIDESLDPWLGVWEDEAQLKLTSEQEQAEESIYMEFNRAAGLNQDLATRYRSYHTAHQGGWMTVNEIRQRENMSNVGPQGDILLSPGNMVPAETLVDAQNSLVSAITYRMERLDSIEQKCLERLKPQSFIKGIESFYMEHEERIVNELQPLLQVWTKISGNDCDAAEVASSICENRKAELIELTGQATPDDLHAKLNDWMTTRQFDANSIL